LATSANPALNVGGIAAYTVLYEGTGTNQLSITNDTIAGNIGVGGGKVAFNGPGVINGRLDFAGANSSQYSNTNATNVGPTSVSYGVSAVTTAINAVNSLNTTLAGLSGTSITFNNANQTVNESSGTLQTTGGVTYRVFNVLSYSETNSNTVTINGDGSGDPVVFNFKYSGNVNLGGQVALSGSGLSNDLVMWNFTNTGKQVSLNNNGGNFRGVIIAPNEQYQSCSSNLEGRVYGGSVGNMQIVSGANVYAPPMTGTLNNTATVTESNESGSQTASATITITSSMANGDTATIGFWHNSNGQALINSLNGGSTSTALAKWLATTFPNLYGSGAGNHSMPYSSGPNAGKPLTNADVAALYLTSAFFGASGQKTDAQVLSVALAVYVTSTNLSGTNTLASHYGFNVSTNGVGSHTFNIGLDGAAFGVANNTTLTLLQMLVYTNSASAAGVLYTGNTTLINQANDAYSSVNQIGDII
jgi:choice-of-anchor A domain-containing protein